MKFKSKSEVIEAVQWQGYTQDAEEKLLAWGIRPETMSFHPDNSLEFRTSTGSTNASTGDWIVRSSSGEFYSCHQKAFEAIYEPVLDDPAPRSFAPGQIAGMSISFPHDLTLEDRSLSPARRPLSSESAVDHARSSSMALGSGMVWRSVG